MVREKINLQINRTVILVCAGFSMDVLSVPHLQVLWPITAVQALILHPCSQSPGQLSWCYGNLSHCLPQKQCAPLDGPKWSRHLRYSKGFLSLIIPYHLRLSLVLEAEVLWIFLLFFSLLAKHPPAVNSFTLHSQFQVRPLTDTSPGTGLHDRKSAKCIYLCYLASFLGQTLLTQKIKLRGKKEILCPALSVKQTYHAPNQPLLEFPCPHQCSRCVPIWGCLIIPHWGFLKPVGARVKPGCHPFLLRTLTQEHAYRGASLNVLVGLK